MPRDIAAGDRATQDHWIFLQAAVWPDVARKDPCDRPVWHYVDKPTLLGKPRPVNLNLSDEYPTKTPIEKFNCAQALKYSLDVLKDRKASPDAKAESFDVVVALVTGPPVT